MCTPNTQGYRCALKDWTACWRGSLCLSSFGATLTKYERLGVFKTIEIYFHSCGGWEVKIYVPADFGLVKVTFWFINGCLWLCPHKRGKGTLWVSFIRTLNSFMGPTPS